MQKSICVDVIGFFYCRIDFFDQYTKNLILSQVVSVGWM